MAIGDALTFAAVRRGLITFVYSTLGIALVGFVATYINNRVDSRRKDRLEHINRQINDFYGPLYIATEAGEVAFRSLWRKLRPERVLSERPPSGTELQDMTDKEFNEWRLWCQAVFRPMNDFREKLILENAYLIEDRQAPDCLLEFIAHASAFKAMMARWDAGDTTSERVTVDFPFPEKLRDYSAEAYLRLKERQLDLLDELHRERRWRLAFWRRGKYARAMRRLQAAAKKARANAYAPYSQFSVGAAVETEDGSIFAGCNVENRAYPQTLCAERNAIGAAVAAGHKKIKRVYVLADPIGRPCGGCRSVIAELGGKDAEVVCASPNGATEAFTLDQLLPHAFETETALPSDAQPPAGS